MKNRIVLAIILCVTTWVVITGIAYGATLINNSANAVVKITPAGDFTFYVDPSGSQPLINVSLPDVPAGGTSAFTVYVKNTGTQAKTISAGSNTVSASTGSLTLTFDGNTQEILQPGAIAKVVGTFNAPATASAGTVNFTFTVNAADVTFTSTTTTSTILTSTITTTSATASTTVSTTTKLTTTTTTTTSAAAVSYASAIQPVFNSYCVRCHSGGSINLSSYAGTLRLITPGNAAGSVLYQSVTTGNMAAYGMSAAQKQALGSWINAGAPNN